ncbi:type IVa pilus major pilin TapA [Aeromonas taiwanensis]|uniref:type IVa pilus major pilin TapA n=1 Tax=Aeromonas taiwanensis TaxID=633417 RepID=UPI003B9F9983
MKRQSGFTLIELMIVVAIVAILAAIALPAYQNYTKKARFSEVVAATGAAKTGVEVCYSNMSDISVCDAGSNGVPANPSGATGLLASLTTTNGVITATAVGTSGAASSGLNGETYVLTPTISNNKIIWDASAGTCTGAGIC